MHDIFEFKADFDQTLAAWFSNKKQSYTSFQSGKSFLLLIDQAEKILLSGGKRSRPYLISLCSQETEADATKLLIAIELFHLFCLIHDDVMDEATHRHQTKTAHHFLEGQYKEEKRIGNITHLSHAQAILLGDLIFSWVFELLFSLEVSDEKKQKIHVTFQQMIAEVMYGQSIDVDIMSLATVSDEMLEENMYYKTASYTFIRPLELGLVFSDQEALIPAMRQFGKALGLAFQIQDDLIDLVGKDSGKDQCRDIEEGEATLFSNYIFHRSEAVYREALTEYFRQPLDQVQKDAVLQLMHDAGAIDYGKEKIEEYYQEAKDILATMEIKNELRLRLEGLIAFLKQRSY